MATDHDRDPERARIRELLERVRAGAIDDAEREELSLYADSRPDVAEAWSRAEDEAGLGGEWLVRVQADRRNEAAGRSKLAVAERTVGSTLAVGGAVGALFVPALGLAALAGLGILGLSALRVHVTTSIKDPYRDVEK